MGIGSDADKGFVAGKEKKEKGKEKGKSKEKEVVWRKLESAAAGIKVSAMKVGQLTVHSRLGRITNKQVGDKVR